MVIAVALNRSGSQVWVIISRISVLREEKREDESRGGRGQCPAQQEQYLQGWSGLHPLGTCFISFNYSSQMEHLRLDCRGMKDLLPIKDIF